jgi:hypothetical protein
MFSLAISLNISAARCDAERLLPAAKLSSPGRARANAMSRSSALLCSSRGLVEVWRDDGNLLSYDLARILVEQLAKSWEPIKHFVVTADRRDSGASAASAVFGIDLGSLVCALLERDASSVCAPDPQAWHNGRVAKGSDCDA